MHVFIHTGEEPYVCLVWEAVPSHNFLDKSVVSMKDEDI
jgi:hypothetical protein